MFVWDGIFVYELLLPKKLYCSDIENGVPIIKKKCIKLILFFQNTNF